MINWQTPPWRNPWSMGQAPAVPLAGRFARRLGQSVQFGLAPPIDQSRYHRDLALAAGIGAIVGGLLVLLIT